MLQNLVEGRFRDLTGADVIAVLNPASGSVISECPDTPAAAVDEAVAAAKRAQPGWAKLPEAMRAKHLHALADVIRNRQEEIARAVSQEQGKILATSRAEVASMVDYMAEWARLASCKTRKKCRR